MQTYIVEWYHDDCLKGIGVPYRHDDCIDIDINKVFDIAEDIFNHGLNVLIKRHKDGDVIIGVSATGFGQK